MDIRKRTARGRRWFGCGGERPKVIPSGSALSVAQCLRGDVPSVYGRFRAQQAAKETTVTVGPPSGTSQWNLPASDENHSAAVSPHEVSSVTLVVHH